MSTKKKQDTRLIRIAKRKIVFGQHIRYLRGKLGISQEELANRLGLTRTSIVNIECGRQIPQLVNLPDYATALETSVTIISHGIRE